MDMLYLVELRLRVIAVLWTLLVFVSAVPAFAEGRTTVYPMRPSDLSSIPNSNVAISGKEDTKIEIHYRPSCYPSTNLRYDERPLNPFATITTEIFFRNHDPIVIKTPAREYFPEFGGVPADEKRVVSPSPLPAGWSFQQENSSGWMLLTTSLTTKTIEVAPDGSYDLRERPVEIVDVRYSQEGLYGVGGLQGSNGPLTPKGDGGEFSFDGTRATLRPEFPGAAKPGQIGLYAVSAWVAATNAARAAAGLPAVTEAEIPKNGWCGSTYSPLMLFTDDKRPTFTGKSHFPLIPNASRVFWVEPGAPGWFLAYDENGDGKIGTAGELFSSAYLPNGFEQLRAFDQNGDQKIDARDPKFSKLLLWSDANGDGISESSELRSIASLDVVSIDLRYDDRAYREIGERAELRQSSTFVFKKNGAPRKGTIIDYWFHPAPEYAPIPRLQFADLSQ